MTEREYLTEKRAELKTRPRDVAVSAAAAANVLLEEIRAVNGQLRRLALAGF